MKGRYTMAQHIDTTVVRGEHQDEVNEPGPRWSEWMRLDPGTVKSMVHTCQGTYRTRVTGAGEELIYIGSAVGKSGLAQRLGQRAGSIRDVWDRDENKKSYLAPAEKDVIAAGHILQVSFACASSREEAKRWEAELIAEYEAAHGRLPPGNTQRPRLQK